MAILSSFFDSVILVKHAAVARLRRTSGTGRPACRQAGAPQILICRSGGTGRHARLKIASLHGRVGSTPTFGRYNGWGKRRIIILNGILI